MNSIKSFIIKGAFAAILLAGVAASADAVSAASPNMASNDIVDVQRRPIDEIVEMINENAPCKISPSLCEPIQWP